MNKGGIHLKRNFAVFSTLCALFVLLFASQQVIESSRYGLRLCIELILPNLFPFFVISFLLSRLGFPVLLGKLLAPFASRFFRSSGTGVTALFVGLTGGYPMGAAYLAELIRDGSIETREGERLLAFCNNSGPAFLVGAIGAGVYGSSRIGLSLYGVHILAAVLTGLLFRGKKGSTSRARSYLCHSVHRLSALLPEAVQQSVTAILNVCGFVVCFSVFTGLLETSGAVGVLMRFFSAHCNVEPRAVRAFLIGFWELGSGIGAMRSLPPTPFHLALSAFLAGWGGVSVHFQTLAVLSDTEIKGALHTAGRLIHAVLSFILMYVFAFLKT